MLWTILIILAIVALALFILSRVPDAGFSFVLVLRTAAGVEDPVWCGAGKRRRCRSRTPQSRAGTEAHW